MSSVVDDVSSVDGGEPPVRPIKKADKSLNQSESKTSFANVNPTTTSFKKTEKREKKK